MHPTPPALPGPRAHLPAGGPRSTLARPVLDVVIPVFNEQHGLDRGVRLLHRHLVDTGAPSFRITIADNASTDATLEVARALETEIAEVAVVHLDAKGRGRALQAAWSTSDAEVLCYMDVDLSTGLNALAPLISPLLSGHSDLAIGSRLARGSRVVRSRRREVISRGYNLILQAFLAVRCSDAQCGFKAIRADAAAELLPLVEDTSWFFDTELLVLAERAGLRIHEVPVDWVEDPDSRVDLIRTATDDLRGCWRVRRALARHRLPLDTVTARLVGRRLAAPAAAAIPVPVPGAARSPVVTPVPGGAPAAGPSGAGTVTAAGTVRPAPSPSPFIPHMQEAAR